MPYSITSTRPTRIKPVGSQDFFDAELHAVAGAHKPTRVAPLRLHPGGVVAAAHLSRVGLPLMLSNLPEVGPSPEDRLPFLQQTMLQTAHRPRTTERHPLVLAQ